MAPVGLDIIMRRLCTYTPRYYGLCPRPDVDQIAARPPSGVCGKRWRNRSKVSVRSLILSFFLYFFLLAFSFVTCFFFLAPRHIVLHPDGHCYIISFFLSLFLLIMIIFVKKEGKIITKQRRMWRTVNSRNRKRKEKNESSVKSRQRRNSMERERIRR